MASKVPPNKSYRLSIPMVFKRRKKDVLEEISSEEYSTVLNEIHQPTLNSYCRIKIPSLNIDKLLLCDGKDMSLLVIVTSEEQLQHVFDASKKEQTGKNLLSRTLTEYADNISLELSVGNRLKDKLHVFAEMTGRQLGEGLIALDDIDETVETTKSAQPEGIKSNSQETGKEEPVKKKVMDEVKKIEKKYFPRGTEIAATPGPGIPMDRPNCQRDIREEKNISKDLRICLSAKDEFPSVVLRSNVEQLNGMSLIPYKTLSNMFRISLIIPESFVQRVHYWYEITYIRYFEVPVVGKYFPKLERSSKTEETGVFLFDREPIQRDVLGKDVVNCIANHLHDIIFDSVQGSDLEKVIKCIKEIELLTKKLQYFALEKIKTVIKFLLDSVGQTPNSADGLLILIVMYNCLINISDLKHCQLIQDSLKKVLPCVKEFRLDELPCNNPEKMVDLCLLLCEITLNEKFCLLTFMDLCYPFLNEFHFNNLTSRLVSRRQGPNFLGKNGMELIPLAKKICGHLINKCLFDKESVGKVSLSLLKRMLFHLPIEYVVNICKELFKRIRESDSLKCAALQKEIQETVTNTIKCAFMDVKKKKSFERMENLWTLVFSEIDLPEELVTLFEIEILEMLDYNKELSDQSYKAFETLALTQGLFEGKDKKCMLMKKISDSHLHKIHSFFIVCIKSEKFSSVLEKDVYVAWLKKDIQTHWTQYKCNIMLAPYCSIRRLLNVEPVCANEVTRTAIFQIAFSNLQKNKLKDVLQHMDDETEDKVGTFVFDKLKDHVMQMVKKEYESNLPNEILGYISTNGQLRVNTRLTVSLVGFLLDGPLSLLDNGDVLELFCDVFKQRLSWKFLLTGSGKSMAIIKKNKNFLLASECLESVRQRLKKREVTFGFLKQFNQDADKGHAIELLGVDTHESFFGLWRENEKLFKQKLNDIEVIQNVLNDINDNVNNKDLPFGFGNTMCFVNEFDENIRLKMTAKELKDKSELKQLKELQTTCKILQKVVHSRVFWNLSFATILLEYEDKECTEDKTDCHEDIEDILESISFLFQSEPYEVSPRISNETLSFLDIVLEFGGNSYKEEWNALMKDSDYLMSRCYKMFHDCNIQSELQIAEKYLHTKIKDDTKSTLKRLENLKTLQDSVHAMKSSVSSCRVKDIKFFKAVESFFDFCNGDFALYNFQEVGNSLSTVFNIAEPLHKETLSILESIGEASILMDFLFEIVDDDIRNLIDAVEDISEKHVQETTVAALIEVKRFVQPILKNENNFTAEEMFQAIDKQVNSNVQFARKMPGNIEDCRSNIHNLKSLYNNVANRSEQTKEIILNLVKRGKFSFTLNDEGTDCDFMASYSQKGKSSHSRAALTDLRSRALLLTNKNDGKGFKGYELDSFVSHIDTCSEIASIVVNLHATGHTRFKSYLKKEDESKLKQLKLHLGSELIKWQNHLEDVRKKYYLVNFLQGFEIHKLHTYLVAGSMSKHKDQLEAQTLLKNIHPNLELSALKEHFVTLMADEIETDEYIFIKLVGNALHMCLENLSFYQRCIKSVTMKDKTLVDVVQKSRPLLVQLEESSLLVVRTVVTLFCNTVQRFPESSQVLFCTRQTRWEELDLLLSRCQGAFAFYDKVVLYCIANVELLSNEIQFELVEAVRNLDQSRNYHLAIICRGSRNHPFIDELSEFNCKVRPLTDKTIEEILQNECPGVTTTSSEVAGLGKTTEIVKEAFISGRSVATLHISGPMTKERIVNRLSDLDLRAYQALHIDIGSITNTSELDTLLFELIVLRFITTGKTSIYLQTSFVSIEIANSLEDNLRKSLQTAILFQRRLIFWQNYDNLVVSREINSPIQVVCHFFQSLDKNAVDSSDIFFTGPQSVKPLSTKVCQNLLRKHLPSNPGISFSTVNIFLNVLADQLKKMASSSFFRISRIRDMIGHKANPTIRSSLVQALVEVSKEFSSRSVDACRSTQKSTLDPVSDHSETSTADVVTQRIESMIRWEDSNHLMYVFHNQNIQTLSPIYRDRTIVPSTIKTLFESQMKKDMQDYKQMDQNELQVVLQKICRSKPLMLQEEKLNTLSKDYALTPDNLLKMILIMLRVKSGIPVLVMGETGCGKTSLIRYLANVCEVQFDVLNIHAGVVEETIEKKVMKCNDTAMQQTLEQFWLFFDEINTSEYVGLISDIICHHSFLGKKLAPNLVVMGACNPYKLRSSSAILTAGLKGRAKMDHLSRLVYRVLPLPEMVIDYVWDFGSLNDVDEKVYIHQMIKGVFFSTEKYQKLLTELLAMSQSFIRDQENTSCCVSLRDVQRCKTLLIWFLDVLQRKTLKMSSYLSYRIDRRDRAIILAIAHCYHSRISDINIRKRYRERVSEIFKNSNKLLSELDVNSVIKEEQEDILNRMDLPMGTAKNTALRENVFILLVSILNRIPIFVVGKPGCSKSLSMQVIRSNLRGQDSRDEFFKTLPQLYCVSFQGSESSTSDGIIKVFEKAERYQETNHADSVLSVVILDEIGLAEISRFNPLKVLHNLLEPDGKDRPNVAVVGISNWSLDASKMNRAIHLSRPDMDEDELFETGKSISDSFVHVEKVEPKSSLHTFTQPVKTLDFRTSSIEIELNEIAVSYFRYTEDLRFKNFHGLRDFYSLVKYFAKEIATNPDISQEQKRQVMIMGLERNFGGLPEEKSKLFKHFKVDDIKHSCPVVNLIKENVQDPLARHLMLITSGESVIGILEKSLDIVERQNREIIFGSQFEEDLTDDYNYRILNRIILCMEQGFVLILKDLENIYGSLYDMLNQNYTVIGKKKNCRVALGPYSNPICQVAETFRCIVLVDENKVQHSDPPFLNRFEKQYLRFADSITKEHTGIIDKIEHWVRDISNCGDFDEFDAFPIFSKDMVTSLVLKNYTHDLDEYDIIHKCKKDLLFIVGPEVILRLSRNEKDSVLDEVEELTSSYLELPVHNGIKGFMESELFVKDYGISNQECQMYIIFTKSNIHTKVLQNVSDFHIQTEKLAVFKSEKQLASRMHTFWLESDSDILFVQCSAIDDEKHIMLAKSTIEKFRQEYLKTSAGNKRKHVFLIIHLDSSKGDSSLLTQINFMISWRLVTIDSLETPKVELPLLCKQSLHEALKRKQPLGDYIKEQLFWAFTRIKYLQDGRDVQQLTNIMTKIRSSEKFVSTLENFVISWITNNYENIDDTSWQLNVACNRRSLQTSSCFIEALEMYILNIIDIPLVKYLYVLEKQNMIETFFVEDENDEERITTWVSLVTYEGEFCIKAIPDNFGPESYICNTRILDLRMPFSVHIFENVEETMDEFIYTVKILKGKCGLEPDEDLPFEILYELQKKQELVIYQQIPRLVQFNYVSAADDYFNDFCSLKLAQLFHGCIDRDIHDYMKFILSEKVNESDEDLLKAVTSLHIAFWNNSSLITSQLQLFATCRDLFSQEDLDSLTQRKSDVSLGNESDNVGSDKVLNSSDDCSTREDNAPKESICNFVNVSEITVNSEYSDEPLAVNEEFVAKVEIVDLIPNAIPIKSTVNSPTLLFSNSFENEEESLNKPECDTGFLTSSGQILLETSVKHSVEKEKKLQVQSDTEIHVMDPAQIKSKEYEILQKNFKTEKLEEFNAEECIYSRADQLISKSRGYAESLESFEKIDSHNDLFDYQRTEENKPVMLTTPDYHTDDSLQAEDDHPEKGSISYHDNEIVSQIYQETENEVNVSHASYDQNNSEEENSDIDTKDVLVEIVCERMLPYDMNVDINQWRIKANKVLALVVQVSPESKFIHHLRICSDIVAALIVPYKVELCLLQGFAGQLLMDRSLDTDGVYEALGQIFDQTSPEAVLACQRILSGYFVRCLLSDPDSIALDFFLKAICANTLSFSNSFVFKPVWSLSIQYQLDQDEDCLLKLLKQDEPFGGNQEEDNESSCQDSNFLSKLNETVITLLEPGDIQCPYIIMLVDVIEDVFRSYISENENELDAILANFMDSHHILTCSSQLDLQYIVAAGFYKACTNHVVNLVQSKMWKTNEKTLEYMKAILSDQGKSDITKMVQTYFLKVIGFNEISRERMKQICEMKDAFTDFEEKLPSFAYALIEFSVASCPLLIYLDKEDQGDFQALLEWGKDDFSDIVKKYEKKSKGLVLFAAHCEKKFFNPRSHTALDDHIKTLSLSFSKGLKQSDLSSTAKVFFSCLIGTEDFGIANMNQSEQTPSNDCLLNRFLVSLLTLCVANYEEKAGMSVFMKCLFSPMKLNRSYLPATANGSEPESNFFWTTSYEKKNHRFFICECYQRGSVKLPFEGTVICPQCSKSVDLEEKDLGNLLLKESISITEGRTQSVLYSTSHLSPLACQVLFLITKSCLLGSIALKKALPEELEDVLRTSPIDIPHTLWNEAVSHWTNIGELLGMEGQTVGFFLQTVLKELNDLLFDNCPQMKTAEEQLSWENKFNIKLRDVYNNRFELQEQMFEHLRLFHGKANDLEDEILEIGTGKHVLASLFRIKGSPSYNNFVNELLQFDNEFIFLKLVIQLKDKLTLPLHIKPIVQWHMSVVSLVNYVMRKQDCLDMTVIDFMKQIGDKEKTEILGKRFEEMKQSWSFLKKNIDKSISEKMSQFHFKSKMVDCVIYTEECVMFKVLEHIARIQNDFLDLTLSISGRCESLAFLLRAHSMSMLSCVKIEDATKAHLLQFTVIDPAGEKEDEVEEDVFDWEAVIQDNSQSDTLYGRGQRIWYDFHSIERLLSNKLVPGKTFLVCSYHDLPKMVFTDELYKNYVSLSDDVRGKVRQRALSSDLVSSIHNKHKEDRRMCSELMIQIGMIMTLLNKTGGDPDRCLIDYIEEMKNVLTKKFTEDLLPSPSNSVKLGHIVSLYEILEELNAESIIDALSDEFRAELELDHKNILKSLVKNKKRIASSILHACKRFVTRCLSLQEADTMRPLLDYLADVSFWPEGVCDGHTLKDGGDEVILNEIFPKQVMVEHITVVVTVIETEIESIRQESNQMSKLAATFKSSQGSTPVAANTRKKNTATKKRKTFAV